MTTILALGTGLVNLAQTTPPAVRPALIALLKGERARPSVEYRHGASPRQSMTHIALNVNTEKSVVAWGRPVKAQECNGHG